MEAAHGDAEEAFGLILDVQAGAAIAKRSIKMKTLILLAIALGSLVHADVAKVAKLKGDEKIEVQSTIMGNVAQITIYRFTADKVVVENGDKKVGEVQLTDDEKAAIDRYLDQLRKERQRKSGNSIYTVHYYRDGREQIEFREQFQIDFPTDSKAKVLTLGQLTERAAK